MFGKYSQEVGPGLSWWWPSPIGNRDVVQVDIIRKLELGVRNDVPVLDESLMITGDPDELGAPGEAPNLVDVQLTVQYDIKNISKETINDGSSIYPWIQFSGLTIS